MLVGALLESLSKRTHCAAIGQHAHSSHPVAQLTQLECLVPYLSHAPSCEAYLFNRVVIRTNQKVLSKMLHQECSELKVVCNGKLALEEFTKKGPFGIVILDVHMPIMGGREAAMLIRQQNQAVPVIFLTGELASELQGAVQEYSPCSLLIKPCSKKHLLEVSQ
jgi:CheY-like chemotaxis protein